MTARQQAREAGITTPLGDDVLLLREMTMTEELGRFFTIDLELLSTTENIIFEDLLGQKVTVWLDIFEDEQRFFNGHVSRFSQFGNQGSFAVYKATVHPWLWFLTRTSDCCIFQQKTVPDIIKDVFRRHGYTDFEERLSGSYRTWEYCVQYRETDFNFVSRLMEQEGIYYYFKHEEEKHTLILSDAYSSHEPVPGYESILYYPPDDSTVRDEESISNWDISKQVQPGIYALNEYDFKRPKANLEVSSNIARDYSASDFEVYDYPGEYVESAEGDSYVRTRIEELHAQYELAQGQSDARGIMCGGLFELSEYPREDQDREYLVIAATHTIYSDAFESSSGGGGPIYSNSFSVIDSQTSFRPERITPKPMVQGLQTAIVVGPSGEEIWTDEYGRVKVQFHWDRYGESNENSSCWVRVSQSWAGSTWGAMHLPHVGHEVILSFVEGDPDRPIITGRVYNGVNKPADSLPAEQHKSVIRSFGDNDIVVEDKEGDKHIQIKQACGNEIKLHETTPDIEIKQECGNKVLLKASGPDIELKQDCGNEVLMHAGEGIQVRDSFGNEIVLDSAGGTIKIRSPSHESVIELGKSIWWGTTSDEKKKIQGNVYQVIHGSKQEFIAGPVSMKWDGINAKVHGGLVSDTFIGGKHSSLVGVQYELNKSHKIVRGLATEDKKISGQVKAEAGANYLIKSPRVTVYGTTEATLRGGKILLEGGPVTIKSTGEIDIKGSPITITGKVTVEGDLTVTKDFTVKGKSNQG